MTNTRITDPEIFERRYPLILRQFGLRSGTGGVGQYKGGDGVIREIEFLSPDIQVSILSERRVFRPFGLEGGGDGANGKNIWVKQRREEDGDTLEGEEGRKPRIINLGGKVSCAVTVCAGRSRADDPLAGYDQDGQIRSHPSLHARRRWVGQPGAAR